MTWDEIAQLHKDGFEIGNHTRDHKAPSAKDPQGTTRAARGDQRAMQGARHPAAGQLRLSRQRAGQGRPADPARAAGSSSPAAAERRSIPTTRGGASPTSPASTIRCSSPRPATPAPPGRSTTSSGPSSQARDGKIAVLQFHGVPDTAHAWVNTPKPLFESYVEYLADNGYKVIALRDLARYVDPDVVPADPWGVIEERQRQQVPAQGRK